MRIETTEHCTLYLGDCLESLRVMPDRSVNCCVTSPPYWGLRDYGVVGQLGLEPTPESYVEKMVEVFREVRRVLRDDGTLWLNLGLSYASGGTRPSQSPLLGRVPACGTCGKESQDSQASGRVYLGLCDGLQGEIRNRRADIARNGQSDTQGVRQTSRTVRDTEHEDFDQEQLGALPHAARLSTIQKSSSQHQDAFCLSNGASASQQLPLPSSAYAHQSEHTVACTCGTSETLPPLVVHTEGKESFFSACRAPGCRGIGRCGLCWCSLSIPSLNIKQKDEINTPHLVAMALQADGWILRQTVIWAKPNPMPESVTDRCTKAHEYVFLLSKSARYFYDAGAVKEDSKHLDAKSVPYATRRVIDGTPTRVQRQNRTYDASPTRNRRSVWHISTRPYKGAHFATFPPALIEPCIKAGCPVGGVVLDPFGGSGTTGRVASDLGRQSILCELNPDYIELIRERLTAPAKPVKKPRKKPDSEMIVNTTAAAVKC